jgi:hypothetical protein
LSGIQIGSTPKQNASLTAARRWLEESDAQHLEKVDRRRLISADSIFPRKDWRSMLLTTAKAMVDAAGH